MLYALTDDDLKVLRQVIQAVKSYGPAAFTPKQQRRYYIDRRGEGQLTATLSSTATSGKVDHIRMFCGVSPTTSSTATITIYNPRGIAGANDDWVSFQWCISSTQGSTSETSTIKGNVNDVGAWEIIRSGGSIKHGTLDGNLNYGGTATVSVFTGTMNSETDSGENITGVGCKHLTTGKKLASGSWVTIANIDGKWYVVAGPCEVAQ